MNTRKQESKETNQTSVSAKISHILHQTRINKHYSLADLQRITKIKITYLKAIDSGNFKAVPEGFYLRAFIKKFADTVGINGSELLKRYNNELPDLQDPHYMDKVSEDKLLVRATHQRIENRHSTIRKYIPLLVMVVVVFMILVGIWAIASHQRSGFSSDYEDHSTSMSENSSIKEAKQQKTYDHKYQILVKKGTKQGKKLIYSADLLVPSSRVTFESPAKVHLTMKGHKRVLKRIKLRPDQKRSFKISKHDRSLRFALSSKDKVKMKINHRAKQLNPKRSVKSIILKFSK